MIFLKKEWRKLNYYIFKIFFSFQFEYGNNAGLCIFVIIWSKKFHYLKRKKKIPIQFMESEEQLIVNIF